MARFDPYHKWFGIPPKDQPPHHYRLLGIELFEVDPDVIDVAANKQMTLLKQCATGPHMALSQRLLNEVATARLCLLNPAKRAAYDDRLRRQLAVAPTPGSEPLRHGKTLPDVAERAVEANPFGFAKADSLADSAGRILEPNRVSQRVILFAVPILLGICGVLGFLFFGARPKLREMVAPALTSKKIADDQSIANEVNLSNGTPKDSESAAVAASAPATSPRDAGEAVVVAGKGQTPAAPNHPAAAPGSVSRALPEITNSIGMKLVEIPAGKFLMGSADDLQGRATNDEQPRHSIKISQPFFIGVREVTQAEYEQVMDGKNPSPLRDSSHPVCNLTWGEAVEFCRRLSSREAETYRLPTEAEWEYACRAGSETAWHFGDQPAELSLYAWYANNANAQDQKVGKLKPNAFGLFDIDGNVSEWCLDWYGRDYYETSPFADPPGSPEGSSRVVRGGNWDVPESECRSAYRGANSPESRSSKVGFRVVRMRSSSDSTAEVDTAQTTDSNPPAERLPVPDNRSQVTSRKDLQAIFKADFERATTAALQLELAGRLLEKGAATQEDPVGSFVLCGEARDLAIKAGDTPLAFRAIDVLDATYQIDPVPMQVAAVMALEKTARRNLQKKGLAEESLNLIDEILAADKDLTGKDFESAQQIAELAQNAAKGAGESALLKQAIARMAEIKILKQHFAEVPKALRTLKTEPDDAVANLAVGRFECLFRGDWEQGLPRLARCGDSALKNLAGRELAEPAKPLEQLAIADSWWDLAEKQPEFSRLIVRRHAADWYSRAIPELSGLAQDKAEKRVEEVSVAEGTGTHDAGSTFPEGKGTNLKKGTENQTRGMKSGLVAHLFNNTRFSSPTVTRVDFKVDFDWNKGAPDPAIQVDYFSIRWMGFLKAPQPGRYTIVVDSDDGNRVYIDGKKVSGDIGGGPFRSSAAVNFSKLPRAIQIDFVEKHSPAHCRLRWSQDGGFSERIIAPEYLFHLSGMEPKAEKQVQPQDKPVPATKRKKRK